jgi:mevalonate kinase
MTVATAPGKIILLGEHAVVYGRPAIAAPVWQTVATATIEDRPAGSGCVIAAHDIEYRRDLGEADDGDPLALVTRLALAAAGIEATPDWQIELSSTIPIASGLGSGAALSTALVRAVLEHAGLAASTNTVSRIVFESERIYHGTPSGIDNTVIACGVPIWFVRGQNAETFRPPQPFTLVIADSGIRSPTKETVGDVRRAWEADAPRYEAYFDAIAELALQARTSITHAGWRRLGALMNENQTLLEALGVSSPLLEGLIAAARSAGALGSKLSGGGRGGNVIALVDDAVREKVTAALLRAGALRVIATEVS